VELIEKTKAEERPEIDNGDMRGEIERKGSEASLSDGFYGYKVQK